MAKEYSAGEKFKLEEGNVIAIPHEAICCRAKTRKKFPETPRVVHLRPVEGEDTFEFFLDSGSKNGYNARGHRFILFVSQYVRPGDRVVIRWRDPNCACADKLELAG